MACSPRGDQKSPKIRWIFENFLNWLWDATGAPKWPHRRPKEPKKTPKRSLWRVSGTTFNGKTTTLAPCQNTAIYHTFKLKSSSGTTRCRPERKLMPTSLHGWQLNPISLSPLTCLVPWRVQIEPQRTPKGSKKGPQNDRKSTRNPPGHLLACPGVSGGTPQVPPNAYLCIFCAYLCIFMHILAIFLQYLCTYSLVLYIFMHIFVNATHIYAYLCIFWQYLCIFMHMTKNYTKLHSGPSCCDQGSQGIPLGHKRH